MFSSYVFILCHDDVQFSFLFCGRFLPLEEEDKSKFKGALVLKHARYFIFLFCSVPFEFQDWLLESSISTSSKAKRSISWTAWYKSTGRLSFYFIKCKRRLYSRFKGNCLNDKELKGKNNSFLCRILKNYKRKSAGNLLREVKCSTLLPPGGFCCSSLMGTGVNASICRSYTRHTHVPTCREEIETASHSEQHGCFISITLSPT